MARSKPQATVVANEPQATAAMLELAGLARDIKRIELDAKETIDQVKANAIDEKEPLLARTKELGAALCSFATVNRDQLFGKRKSLSTPFGSYGWRKATTLKMLAKIKVADVLAKLRELDLVSAIRTKEEVDKTAMADWTDSKLKSVGMRRVSKDEFFVDVKDIEEVE
ncbi:host-nuclease inhibitor Gam family protein [Pseudodesulfovibrio sp.]|uniref:host-nuclease inhibitor Gam family protein n=1 Tax=Pseudodesulfovibrio sp. TaxID=2035812 RepID=UPI002617A8EB|nr:host-nuclease inhibitor Gam family protein [Pseudodesulfovibrio sp.]MDD3310986.1 host-nuclease inhibitor Gam family protein [Pseudodesulfovibrio sp.]